MAAMPDSELAPGFLLAAPPLGDPTFEKAVVLLIRHSDQGAMGLVVNRPTDLALGEMLRLAGMAGESVRAPVLQGGPVGTQTGWLLFRSTKPEEGVFHLTDCVHLTNSKTVFARIADELGSSARDPSSVMAFLGYAGWDSGQLENEIGRGAWLPVPFDEALIFEVPADKRWEIGFKRLGISPMDGMSMRSVGQA